MQLRHTPTVNAQYWAAISIASVFGANLGDFVSHDLHLGHWRGLAPLALILGGVLWQERRSRRTTQAYYWMAIVIVRTAATNLADLATHDFRLDYAAVVGGLAAVLVCGLLLFRMLSTAGKAKDGLPPTDNRYWATMLIAGTLGTAAGDGLADDVGLGVGPASALLAAAMTVVFGLRLWKTVGAAAFYWLAIVLIRTTGTTVGDLSAQTIGLATSTVLTGLLLAGNVALWPRRAGIEPSPA